MSNHKLHISTDNCDNLCFTDGLLKTLSSSD